VSIFAQMDDRLDTPAERIDAGADVVPLRRGPEELIDDRYLLDALLENTPDNIYFKDSQSRFIRISASLARWMGLNEAANAIGKSDFDFFGEEHAQKAFADEQRLMRSGEPMVGVEEQESWADGHTTWVSTTKGPLRDRNGAIVGIFGISRDITERKQAEHRVQEQAAQLAEQAQMLERLASQDELTALYNRRGLATVGEHMLYEARRTGTSLGVLFIDLDGLKTINDRFTHRAGDEALRTIGTIMVEATREADVAARIGGDEFCVLTYDATSESIEALADRINEAVANHNRQATDGFDVSVSIGRVLFDARTSGSIDDLIERADTAMYDRKARRVS
jgi:diguanylate cyclase (GGDEF)-like protein/PAS domain S-box-containing protein